MKFLIALLKQFDRFCLRARLLNKSSATFWTFDTLGNFAEKNMCINKCICTHNPLDKYSLEVINISRATFSGDNMDESSRKQKKKSLFHLKLMSLGKCQVANKNRAS